jgi:hypothetical protein
MLKIWVRIDAENFEKMKSLKGVMDRENYPDFYEEESHPNEVASHLYYRFILEENGKE